MPQLRHSYSIDAENSGFSIPESLKTYKFDLDDSNDLSKRPEESDAAESAIIGAYLSGLDFDLDTSSKVSPPVLEYIHSKKRPNVSTRHLNRILQKRPYLSMDVLRSLTQNEDPKISSTARLLVKHNGMIKPLLKTIERSKKIAAQKDYRGKNSIILLEKDGEPYACLLGKEIGSGMHGVIRAAYNLKTGQKIIVKIDREKSRGHESAMQLFNTEKKGLKFFNRYQGNLVREIYNTIYLAQDYIDGVTVEQYLDQIKDKIESDPLTAYLQSMLLITEVMRAIRKMQHKHGVHRDLKLNNLMITNEGECVVIDLDAFTHGKNSRNIPQLPYRFSHKAHLAPEAKQTNIYSKKSDIYSMGVALTSICHLAEKALDNIQDPKLRKSLREKAFDPLADCIQKMKSDAPEARPTSREVHRIAKQVLSHSSSLSEESSGSEISLSLSS